MWPSLLDVFGQARDHRREQGKLYPLPGLLAVVFLALVSGVNSLRQIAEWSRAKRKLSARLGFHRGRMPGYSTIRDALVALNVQELEEALRALMTAVQAEWPAAVGLQGVAVDGKTLRGSSGEEGPLRLLSAMAHGSKWVLAEEAIEPGASEQSTVPELIEKLSWKGYVVTLDALHTNTQVAEAITKKGAIISCA
jgi:hypothetical protein